MIVDDDAGCVLLWLSTLSQTGFEVAEKENGRPLCRRFKRQIRLLHSRAFAMPEMSASIS